MDIKQKILVGILVGSSTTILVGTIFVFPPMIIIGGIGVGLSLRKRLFFKKKKKKEQKSRFKNPFKRKPKQQPHVIRLEPGQQLTDNINEPLNIMN